MIVRLEKTNFCKGTDEEKIRITNLALGQLMDMPKQVLDAPDIEKLFRHIGMTQPKRRRRMNKFERFEKRHKKYISELVDKNEELHTIIGNKTAEFTATIEILTRKVYAKEIKFIKDNVSKFTKIDNPYSTEMYEITGVKAPCKTIKLVRLPFGGAYEVVLDDVRLTDNIAKELYEFINDYQKYKK